VLFTVVRGDAFIVQERGPEGAYIPEGLVETRYSRIFVMFLSVVPRCRG